MKSRSFSFSMTKRDASPNFGRYRFYTLRRTGPSIAKLDGSDYWGGKISGVYKWDTKPDVVNSGGPNDVLTKITGIQQGKPKSSLGNWIMDHTKIGTGAHEVGRLIQKIGL